MSTQQHKTMERELVITRILDAPRELVFRAWTDPAHVARWWGPKGFTNPVCEIDARPGGALHIVMRGPDGSEYPMKGVFHEVLAPERLVFTNIAVDAAGKHLLEGLTEVTLTEQNNKTKLLLKTRAVGMVSFADRMLEGMEAGWTQSLERLMEQLGTKHEPLVIERTFEAPVASVWKALTISEQMKQWYFDIKDFKAEVGFEFQFDVQHEGMKYLHRCKITQVIPGKKLAYIWRYEGYEGDSTVTFELFADGNKTRLKLTHAGLENFPKLPAFTRTNFAQGWTQLISKNLKEYVETAVK